MGRREKAMQSLKRFFRDEEGGTLIEYAFLASLIGLAAFTAMGAVGTSVAQKLDEIAVSLS